MKLSYNWAKRYWKMDAITPEEYAERLHTAGLTVEKTTYLKAADGKVSTNNIVWDIDLPPYRNDLLCMMWNAKESCGLFDKLYLEACLYGKCGPDYGWMKEERPERHDLYLSLTLHSKTEKCSLLQGRVVNQVNPAGILPDFIRDEVIALGYEPGLVYNDLEIYCGRNMGQPLYMLDLTQFPGRELCVCEAETAGYIIHEGKEIWYDKGDMIFTAEGRTIGIGGIVFDDSVRPTTQTTGLIVFSGVMDKDVVQKTMKKIGVQSFQGILASYGSNYGSVDKIVDNAVSYLYEICDAKNIEGITKLTLMDTQRRYIRISVEEINSILDSDFTYEEIEHYTRNGELLAFAPDEDKNYFYVKLPTYHMDEYACDIAQMMINYVGYDRIGVR